MKQKGLFICLFAVMVTVMSAGSASAQVNLLCDPAGCQVDYSTVAQTAWGLQCTGCVSRAELDFTPGTVTSVGTGTGLEGGPITGTGTISLMNTTVTPGTYTRGNFTVDAQGRLTAASSGASVNLEGEVTGVLPTGHGGTGTTSGPTAAQQYLRSTGAGIWGISTIQLSDLPSLSGNYVDLSTAQTVGGSKTFTGRIGASAGLTFGDGTIQTTAAVPPLPAATVPGKTGLTTLDNMATVGLFTSITIGTDGLPVISHQDVGASRILKVAKCGNASCSTACGSGGTVCTTLDGTGDVGQYTSITIGTDGLPVISYYDIANSSLKVAKCGNASCSTACGAGGTVCRTLDNTASVGQFTSVTIGTDGFPVISYWDSNNTSLKVAKCNNIYCQSNWSRR